MSLPLYFKAAIIGRNLFLLKVKLSYIELACSLLRAYFFGCFFFSWEVHNILLLVQKALKNLRVIQSTVFKKL